METGRVTLCYRESLSFYGISIIKRHNEIHNIHTGHGVTSHIQNRGGHDFKSEEGKGFHEGCNGSRAMQLRFYP